MGSVIARTSRSRPASVNIKRPPVPEHVKATLEGQGQEVLHKPSPELLDRLKDVYVSFQTDVVTQENPYGRERGGGKLPQERAGFYGDSFDVGLVASEGYLTVPQVMEIFDHRKKDQGAWPAAKVASSYKLNPADAENLLKYFNNYRIETLTKPDLSPEMKFHKFHE